MTNSVGFSGVQFSLLCVPLYPPLILDFWFSSTYCYGLSEQYCPIERGRERSLRRLSPARVRYVRVQFHRKMHFMSDNTSWSRYIRSWSFHSHSPLFYQNPHFVSLRRVLLTSTFLFFFRFTNNSFYFW